MEDDDTKKPTNVESAIGILYGASSGVGKTAPAKPLPDTEKTLRDTIAEITHKYDPHHSQVKPHNAPGGITPFSRDVSGSMGKEWARAYPEEKNRLFEAVAMGNVKRIAELVESGEEDINQVDMLGRNAMHVAAGFGGLTVCKELVRHGIRLSQKEYLSGNTPLHTAMEKRHDHIAVYLASKGAALAPPRGKLSFISAMSMGGSLAAAAGIKAEEEVDPAFSPGAFDRIREKLSKQQVKKAKGLAHVRRRGPGKRGPQ